VGGFEVAVDDARLVDRRERCGGADREPRQLAAGERPPLGDQRPQRRALDVLAHGVRRVGLGVRRDDRRGAEGGDAPCRGQLPLDGGPASASAAMIGAVQRGATRRAAASSRSKAVRARGSVVKSACRSFTATRRPAPSSPRYTTPCAPSLLRAVSRNPPTSPGSFGRSGRAAVIRYLHVAAARADYSVAA